MPDGELAELLYLLAKIGLLVAGVTLLLGAVGALCFWAWILL